MDKNWIDKQIYWLTATLSANSSFNKNYDSISEIYTYFDSGKTEDAQKAVNLISKNLDMTPPILHYDWSGELDHDSSIKGQMKKGQLIITLTFTLNKFLLAATVIHELMHYFLIHRKNIILPDNLENEKITDLSAIVLGFAVIMLNGKVIDVGKEKINSLGYLNLEELAYACNKINSLRNINGYSGLTPNGTEIIWGTIQKEHSMLRQSNSNSQIDLKSLKNFFSSSKKTILKFMSKLITKSKKKRCPFCRKNIEVDLAKCKHCKMILKENI